MSSTKQDNRHTDTDKKLRLDHLHTLLTNPFIPPTHGDVGLGTCSSGAAATAVAMTTQNAKSLKRKQRLARSILQPNHTNSNSNVKGMTEGISSTETSYLFGNTACCIAWAPNTHTRSLRRKNVHLLAVATPYNALNAMGSLSNVPFIDGDVTDPLIHEGGLFATDSSKGPSFSVNTSLDPCSSVYILVFDEATFHKDANVSILREMADLLGFPPPSKPLAPVVDEEDSTLSSTNQRNILSSLTMERIGILRRNIFQHTIIQRNKYNEDTSLLTTSSLFHATSQEGKTFWASLKNHFMEEFKHIRQVFLYELLSDGRLLSSGDPDAKKNPSVNNQGLSLAPSECPLKPVLVFQISLPSGAYNAMEISHLEWNEDGSALTVIQRKKGGSNFSSGAINAGTSNVLSNPASSLTTATHGKKKKGQHHLIISNFNQSSLSGQTAASFWHVPDWLFSHFEEEMFHKDGGILGWLGDLGTNSSSVDNPLAGMHQDLIVRQSPDGRFADDESEEGDGKTSFPLWDWYLSQYVMKDRDLGAVLSGSGSLHGKEANSMNNSPIPAYPRISLKNMVESYASPMELVAPSPSSSVNSTGINSKPSKKTISKTNGSIMASSDITCILWERNTETIANPNEKASPLDDAHTRTEHVDLATKLRSPRSSHWLALCTTKGQVILHNTAASCVSHFLKRRAQSFAPASVAQALDISSSLQNRTVDVPCKIKKRITCGVWMDNLLVLGTVGSGQLTLVHVYAREVGMPQILSAASEKRHVVSNMIIEDACCERCVNVLGEVTLPGGRDAIDIAMGTLKYDYGGHTTTILSINCEGKALVFYSFLKLPNSATTSLGPLSSQAVEISFAMPSSSPTSMADESFLFPSYRAMSNSRNESGISCGNIMKHFLIPNTALVLVSFVSGYFALVDWENGTILSDAEVASKRYEGDNRLERQSNHFWDDDPFLLDVVFHQPTLTFACLTLTGHVVAMRVRVLVGSHGLKPSDCICTSGLKVNSKIHTRPANKSTTVHGPLSSSSSATMRADPMKDHPLLSTIDTLCFKKIDHVPGRKNWLLSFSSDGQCLSVAAGDEAVYTMILHEDDEDAKNMSLDVINAIFNGFDRRFYLASIICFLYVTWLMKLQSI